jgi:serine/threonine-protein kinase
MVMEFLDGRDLSAELRERGTLPIKECVDYVLQAIEAVAEAHALGIVHRDLKPENLFLARRTDGSRTVKVLDFGISKTIVLGSSEEQSLTRTANIMGSPFYMSPEQMRTPRNVDARSDQWAIGAILYDLITGRPPYVAETIPQLCTMLLESDPAPLLELRPDADPELEQVIARCLAKDVAARWPSVVELAHALLPFASRSSKIHVERAGRVLASSGSYVPPESTLQSSEPPRPATKLGLGHATPTQASNPNLAIPDAPDSSTQDSWGHTHRPNGRTQRGPVSTGRLLAVGGAALLVGAASIVAFRVASSREPDPASVLAPPKDPAPREPAADPALTQAAVEAVQPTPSAPASASAKPEASQPESALDLAKRQPPRPPPPRPKPSASSGLTDFGGRR